MVWEEVATNVDSKLFIDLSNSVRDSKKPNYKGCRLKVPSHINIDYLNSVLKDYSDFKIVEFLTYGWPINYIETTVRPCVPKNHKGATEFKSEINNYIIRELQHGSIVGPFDKNPFKEPLFISPLNSVEKKGSSERRVILDLSFPPDASVNDSIPQG